uniref:Uncharacterized protein n=1 Tax=Romanomermis culicivorax TaxID=13658 RepID=A0A915KVC4_ROMCU
MHQLSDSVSLMDTGSTTIVIQLPKPITIDPAYRKFFKKKKSPEKICDLQTLQKSISDRKMWKALIGQLIFFDKIRLQIVIDRYIGQLLDISAISIWAGGKAD